SGMDHRVSLAIQTEAAIGLSDGGFYNHIIGARFNVRITETILLGAYFGYVNLEGRNGRASNLLGYVQFENRIPIAGVDALTVPIRAALGYLPFNGPWVRIAAGLNYQ